MQLYNYSDAFDAVKNGEMFVDTETGEVFDSECIEALEMSLDEKLENCACLLKDYMAMASSIKAEEAALAERRRRYENRAGSLKEYMLACMQACGKKSLETARCAIKTRNSEAVEVAEDFSVEEFINEKITRTPDKVAIKKAIKAGQEIPGAALVQRSSIMIK